MRAASGATVVPPVLLVALLLLLLGQGIAGAAEAPKIPSQQPKQCNATVFICGSNSTFAPSWCSHQNPFIVARPASPLVNQSTTSIDTLSSKYTCASDDPLAECTIITQFLPVEMPTVNNQTRKLIIMGVRDNNSTTEPVSRLQILDDDFDLLHNTNPMSGLVSTLDYQPARDNADSIMVAYGGTMGLMYDWTKQQVVTCKPFGCAFLGQINYSLVRTGGNPQDSRTIFQLNGIYVANSKLLWGALTYLSDAPVAVMLLSTMSSGAQLMVITSNYVANPPYEPNTISTWSIASSLWNAQSPQPTMQLITHHHGCKPTARNAAFAYGDFFTYHLCNESPLAMIATQSTVAIFLLDGSATATLDMSHPTALFYEADAGRVITAAQVFSQVLPPANVYNTSYKAGLAHIDVAQGLWMIVATKSLQGGANRMELVLLPEFGYNVTAQPRTLFNPAGRATTGKGVCSSPNQYYDAVHGCTSRRTVVWSNPLDEISQIQIVWRDVTDHAKSQLRKAGCSLYDLECIRAYATQSGVDASNLFEPFQSAVGVHLPVTPDQVVGQYMSSSYGLRHVVFASTAGRTLVVLDALPSPDADECPPAGPPAPLVAQVNSLSMMGTIGSLRITRNAQYVFAAVSRAQYALKAMERVVQVCQAYAANPDPNSPIHQFLKPFSSGCTQNPLPRYPALADFLQVASACFPGMSCGSFNDEVVDQMPNGEYSDFFFDDHVCEPGYFCVGGQRQECPTGFYCPGFGNMLPTPCPADPTLNYHCYGGGLAMPLLCPNGTLCGVPYLPPLPAPPGYMQIFEQVNQPQLDADPAIMPYVPPRSLAACTPGQWCNLAASAALTYDEITCPADTYCTSPGVITPTICNMDGRCVEGNCTFGNAPYCPQGSTLQVPCPAGYFCDAPNNATQCAPGSWCPSGSPVWQVCPAGSYCPGTGESRRTCPNGYYCPEARVDPVPCNILSRCQCPHGCSAPEDFLSVPVLIIVPIVLYGLWKLIKMLIKRRRQQRDDMLAAARARGKNRAPSRGVEMESKLLSPEYELDMPLLDEPGMLDNASSMSRKEFTIDFHFEDMGLVLKGSGKPVMKGVTGCIRHGRVTAVMGPSGAGKSTFLTTLAGKATYGKQTGKIFINGNEVSLSHYSKLVGFVPQEDIMMRTMTVAENLQFCAETRLPSHWSYAKKLEFVDDTLGLLGLREIKHSQIGDERKRGISGGQRKRVNIGMEMVADPTVLFLDEPTSGLDSSSSMEVCHALRSIADLGITIVTVIHQPRYEIFTMFHDVLLLGKGGRTVYLGPSEEALDYFEQHGFICPPRVNPPDFFMDVINGDVPPEYRAAHPDFHPNELFTMWEQYQAAGKARTIPKPEPHPASPAETKAVNRHAASFLMMVWLSLKRSMWQHARSKAAIGIDIALVFIAAVALAAVYWGDSLYEPPQPMQVFTGCPSIIEDKCQLALSAIQDNILNRGSMTCIAMGLTGVASMIRVFGAERVQYWREASGLGQPWHTFAYFLGKDLSMLPQIFTAPLVYTLIYLSVTSPRGSFATYYWVLLGMYYTASGYGYLVSIVAPPNLSQLVGVVAVFGNAMFAGGMPVLKQLYTKIPPLCWLPYVSFIRYALEALYVGEVVEYNNIVELNNGWNGQPLAEHLSDTYGYDLYAYGRDIAVLFGIGFILRVLTALIMAVMDRDKKV